MPECLRGIGVSPGVAAGPIARMGGAPVLPNTDRDEFDADIEVAAATDALTSVAADLGGRAVKGPARDILQAQAMLAADPVLLEGVTTRIRQGEDAPHALRNTFDEHRKLLAAAGGNLAERVADLDDIANRTIAATLGQPMPGLPDPGHPYILVADDLSPADTASLDPELVLALVTERGGPTSHTAILARSLGLPAVVGCRGVLAARDTDAVVVDGTTGEVRIRVDEREVADARTRAADMVRPDTGRGPGRTSDGHTVHLMLNIGSAADLAGVDLTDIAGVGLFRTEFLFLDRRQAPDLEEQEHAYAEVFKAFDHGTIVVRTLDAGADKPLPFLGLPDEPNPALGMRGLRVARLHPDVLDTQLTAIARARAATKAEVWVMAPMVSTPREAADFADRAHRHGLPTIGVMIEVPAAALRADRFLEIVDFLSIGTNDLGQYTLAVDRQSGDLPDLLDPWQPALLQLIAQTAAAGRASGKAVGVCGEAAADPLLAPILAGLGVTRLSMTPKGIPAVRAQLGRHTLKECEDLARRVLDTDDATEARAAAH